MREALKGGRRFLTAQGTGEWILRSGSRGIKRQPIWLTMRQPTEPARALPGDPAGEQADRVVRETGPPPVLGKAWLRAGGSGGEEYCHEPPRYPRTAARQAPPRAARPDCDTSRIRRRDAADRLLRPAPHLLTGLGHRPLQPALHLLPAAG